MAALSVHRLVKHYRAGPRGNTELVRALDGVTLSADEGEIVGVAGPRGSGKSTLLFCAAGLVRPDSGHVAWFGSRMNPPEIPPGIAHVPQRSSYYSFLTVREALEYYATLHDLGTRDREIQVDRAVREVALENFSQRRVGCLASPLLRRLGLAQALIGRPRALLLDGTLEGDPGGYLDIHAVLRRQSAAGTTILIAAQNEAQVANVAHRIVRLSGGKCAPGVETAGFDYAPPPRSRRDRLTVS